MVWLNRIKQYPIAKIILFVAIIFLLVCGIFFWSRKTREVTAGGCMFRAEVADSAREQYRGLSRRKGLAQDHAMLFRFDSAQELSFVMREMNFPLDIIFIKEGKVTNLYRELQAEGKNPTHTYHSGGLADTVLEIPSGRSQSCGIAVGSMISW